MPPGFPAPTGFAIHALGPDEVENAASALGAVLLDCVAGGASVSFMADLTRERAEAFWRGVAEAARHDRRGVLVAEDDEGIAGVVEVIPAGPDNQPHRADIAKMLVHRRARRRGLAEALLRAAESAATAMGKTLLVLDTADETAARLYARLGWQAAGTVPRFALLPGGGECATTYFYRELDA